MTVLKDASATAIYGSRASNGVIIITTKKGKSGRPKVNFAANWHVNTPRKTYNVMSGAKYGDLVRELYEGDDKVLGMLGEADTNWQDEVLRTSFSQDYTLSVSGQAGFLPYRVSASYTNNQGILKTSGMQRTTFGFNLSPKFFNGLLSINANAQGTYVKSREGDTGALGAAIVFNPTLPVMTAYPTRGSFGRPMYNGYTNIISGGIPEAQAAANPLQLLQDVNNTGEVYSSTGNLQIDYALHFLPELHLNLNLGYQVSDNHTRSLTAENSIMNWKSQDLRNDGAAGAGTKYRWWELQRNTLLDFYINYRKYFEAIQSNVDVMAGYSWQRFSYMGHSNTYINTQGFSVAQNGFPEIVNGEYVLDLNPATESMIGNPLAGKSNVRWGNHLQLVSFFGRLNYSLQDTYLLTFTLRDDGTSRFSKENRWGLFPSVALAWKAGNMPVFEDVRSWWNDLKLRLGWGVTGQQDIGSYFPYMPVYTFSANPGFQYPGWNGGYIDPLYPQAYAEDIKWEETTTWNVGLDFGFLNNRITASVDWYLRDTKDLLAYTPVSILTTSDYMNRNIGSLRNTGIEVTIGAKPIVTKDFTWSTGFNYSYNKSEITALTGDAETSQISVEDAPSGTGTHLQFHLVGEAPYSYMVYEQVYDKAGNPVPGQYVDQDGDGKITENDKIIFHSPIAPHSFTWNNTFQWKNWDLGFTLRANVGGWNYNNSRYEYTRIPNITGYQLSNILDDTFLFDQVDSNLILSSYLIENASFLRCDNISLGYTFQNLCKGNLGLRIFGVVQNPFVITKYKGLDPEVWQGIDNNVYPRPLTVTLGVVANF